LAANVAKAAVAAAAKVPSRAVIAATSNSSTKKNTATATITGLKPGQKVKVTVNVKGK
jgi:Flp pilus assembly protein TadG